MSAETKSDGSVEGTHSRTVRGQGSEGSGERKALADRQTDPVPETEQTAQPVVAHQNRKHK